MTNNIQVVCDSNSALVMTQPSTLTDSIVEFKLDDGSKVVVMNPFTTDDSNCPVSTYTAALVSGVT